MIRDPSDGSVKEIQSEQFCSEYKVPATSISGPASGLPPTSTKAAYLERLDWSRELMREWHRTGTFANMTDAGETCEGAARPLETVDEAIER